MVVCLYSKDKKTLVKKTLVLFVDALPFEYLGDKFCSNICSIGEPKKLETLLGYSASIHPSIWTGVLPDKHNSWTEYQLNSIERTPLTRRFISKFPNSIRAISKYPISIISSKLGLGFRPSSLPAEINHMFKSTGFNAMDPPLKLGGCKTVFGSLKGNYNYIVDSIPKPFENNSILDVIYFTSLDQTGHLSGLGNGFEQEIYEIDQKIGKVIKEYEKFDADILVFSDHGMTQINERINIQRILKKQGIVNGKNAVILFNSTMLQIWDTGYGLKKIKKSLDKVSPGHILEKSELNELGLDFKDNRYGDMFFLLDPGVEIFPNFYHNVFRNRVKAMHGYMPGKPYSDGAIVSNKKLKKSNYKITDLFNLILRR